MRVFKEFMKILHIAFVSTFTEEMSYQENLLIEQNIADGHDVAIISACYKYVDGKRVLIKPDEKTLNNGAKLYRIPYTKILTHLISCKINKYKRVSEILNNFSPDVILFHDFSSVELLTVCKYKKKNPHLKLYVDSHADNHNSAHNFISKLLHLVLYRCIAKKAYSSIDKIFYIAYECKDFLKRYYKIPDEKMEFYPLGGIIIDKDECQSKRIKIRSELKLQDNDLLFVHSGKMDARKRTIEILNALQSIQSQNIKLVLIGSMTDDVFRKTNPLIRADKRVSFVGWKTNFELNEYLCACDMYVQPGTQSVTMQNAICCGAAVMLYPYKSHEPYLIDNGFYVETVDDIKNAFIELLRNPAKLEFMREASYKIAYELLDYKRLAARLYGKTILN